MSLLMLSVSDSVSSSVCWPTTLRSVVCAIWLIAACTFSMATTDFTASTTRKYATAETSTLTLSRVMMPCDWMGIVTIRSDTRRNTSTTGMMNRRPGRRMPMTLPSRNRTPCSYCFTMRTDRAASMTTMTIPPMIQPMITLHSCCRPISRRATRLGRRHRTARPDRERGKVFAERMALHGLPAHLDQLVPAHHQHAVLQTGRHDRLTVAGRHDRDRQPGPQRADDTELARGQFGIGRPHVHHEVDRVGAVQRADASRRERLADTGTPMAAADLAADRAQPLGQLVSVPEQGFGQ